MRKKIKNSTIRKIFHILTGLFIIGFIYFGFMSKTLFISLSKIGYFFITIVDIIAQDFFAKFVESYVIVINSLSTIILFICW